MHGTAVVEHTLITTLLVAFHILLLWIGTCGTSCHPRPSSAERMLWRKFVGLMFVVLVIFGNATLVIPRCSERPAVLIAISLLAIIYLDLYRGTGKLKRHKGDADG